jgi:hypothetical protein
MIKTAGGLVLILVITISSYAQSPAGGSTIQGFRIDFEQDYLLEVVGLPQFNTDQNYTQGFGIALFTRPITRVSGWLFPERKMNPYGYNYHYPAEFTFQFGAFTPDELRDSLPVEGDRPYSTIFMLGMNNSLMNTREFKLVQKSLYLGVLGIDGPAKSIQTAVHESWNDGNSKPPYNPMGWHLQISNGGEPTAMYAYNQARLLTKKQLEKEVETGYKSRSFSQFSASYSYGYYIGYLTQANAGIALKFGLLDRSNWASDLFNNLSIVAQAAGEKLEREEKYYSQQKKGELYLYGSFNPVFSLYNASLHGAFRSTAYRLPWEETGFITGQARIGAAWTTRMSSLAAYWAFKLPEMWTHYIRIHSWGGFSLSFYWN